jgi:adenosylhomocysteinase
VTLTGDINVIRREHFKAMKDGAIVCNSGHFNVELELGALEEMSVKKRTTRRFVEEYTLPSNRRVNLLGEGRLINLAAAEGHPASVMDMSFANQSLSAEYLTTKAESLENMVYAVPRDIDEMVADHKLRSRGVEIDELTEEQVRYLNEWTMGT